MIEPEITKIVLKCCFEIMNDLGSGFLESVYKNALVVALKKNNVSFTIEQLFDVHFQGVKVGLYRADIVVEGCLIIELKCCQFLLNEHKAQLINYLKASNIDIGLLVNFGNSNLEYHRLLHPTLYRSLKHEHGYEQQNTDRLTPTG